ncbi:MAG TPA: glycosyltransferase [Solirubrobacteraceae bacterium]|nr:glycosyltransferase [Solirubrobacteraceae bacterium]
MSLDRRAQAPGELRGLSIVCVGFADWDTELWTNQHHLMSRLARHNDVLFIESLGLRRPTLAGRDLRRILRRLTRALRLHRAADRLTVLSPLVLPIHRDGPVRKLNRALLRLQVGHAMRKLKMVHPILWGYVPQVEDLTETVRPRLLVYHCVDDIAAQPGVDRDSFQAAEQRLAVRADLVIASSKPLAERMSRLSPRVLYAPNVADVEHFRSALDPAPVDPAIAALPEPRIIFIGAISANKVDLELVAQLARLRPQWSIALVGPIGPGEPATDVSMLASRPNIHLIGWRRHDQLPALLRGAAAGLIPYAQNQLTASIFPMKVYEYLAAGLPVASTPLASLADIPDVRVGADAAELALILDELLRADSPAERARRSAAAESHSWESRISELARAIAPLLKEG